MNFFKRYRVEWIYESVRVYGYINKAHVCTKFDVSQATASGDLQTLLTDFPNFMKYNVRTKRYERIDK